MIGKKYVEWSTPGGEYQNLYKNMLEQPHLLIAGATGSGKSTLIDDLLYTIGVLHTPHNAKLILIDPKEVQLKRWAVLPHTLKHATQIDDIVQTLAWASDIMEQRFRTMASHNFVKSQEPDIYIFIDEFVDIKLLAGKNAEKDLIRIASKGRAANMHIILATQRPTRDIINGAIKANFSSKIALSTDSRQESRNILDANGAELLPRYGYGFYKTPDLRTPVLYQLEKTTPQEIAKVLNFWANQKPKIIYR